MNAIPTYFPSEVYEEIVGGHVVFFATDDFLGVDAMGATRDEAIRNWQENAGHAIAHRSGNKLPLPVPNGFCFVATIELGSVFGVEVLAAPYLNGERDEATISSAPEVTAAPCKA